MDHTQDIRRSTAPTVHLLAFPPVRVPRWLADTLFFLGFRVHAEKTGARS